MKTQEPGFKLRRVIKESNDERWTYEQVTVPIVADRDYTMYARRLHEPDSGLCQVFLETQNEKARRRPRASCAFRDLRIVDDRPSRLAGPS
ncbi:MAG: hypothetical protein ACRDFW_07900 [bacterium]